MSCVLVALEDGTLQKPTSHHLDSKSTSAGSSNGTGCASPTDNSNNIACSPRTSSDGHDRFTSEKQGEKQVEPCEQCSNSGGKKPCMDMLRFGKCKKYDLYKEEGCRFCHNHQRVRSYARPFPHARKKEKRAKANENTVAWKALTEIVVEASFPDLRKDKHGDFLKAGEQFTVIETQDLGVGRLTYGHVDGRGWIQWVPEFMWRVQAEERIKNIEDGCCSEAEFLERFAQEEGAKLWEQANDKTGDWTALTDIAVLTSLPDFLKAGEEFRVIETKDRGLGGITYGRVDGRVRGWIALITAWMSKIQAYQLLVSGAGHTRANGRYIHSAERKNNKEVWIKQSDPEYRIQWSSLCNSWMIDYIHGSAPYKCLKGSETVPGDAEWTGYQGGEYPNPNVRYQASNPCVPELVSTFEHQWAYPTYLPYPGEFEDASCAFKFQLPTAGDAYADNFRCEVGLGSPLDYVNGNSYCLDNWTTQAGYGEPMKVQVEIDSELVDLDTGRAKRVWKYDGLGEQCGEYWPPFL